MSPDDPLPLRLLPFPDGLYLVHDGERALPRVVMSSQAWRVFEDVDKTFWGECVHCEVRDLPARSRLMWREIPSGRDDDVRYQIFRTRFWIESADGLDLPPHGQCLLVGKPPTDPVRARIFAAAVDPAWNYDVIAREWTVILREPGGMAGPDGVLHPYTPPPPPMHPPDPTMPLPEPPISNAYWAAPHLVACEYPGSIDAERTREKIGALLDAGVTAFVDLTEPGESTAHGPLAPYDALLHDEAARRGLDVTYDRFAVRDLDVPPPETMRAILDHLDGMRDEGRIAALHCRGGIGRTGTVVGCHYVRGGRTGDEALDALAERWLTAGQSTKPWGTRSPETDAQHAYVRAWHENLDDDALLAPRQAGAAAYRSKRSER